jgi:hypothetical protein
MRVFLSLILLSPRRLSFPPLIIFTCPLFLPLHIGAGDAANLAKEAEKLDVLARKNKEMEEESKGKEVIYIYI